MAAESMTKSPGESEHFSNSLRMVDIEMGSQLSVLIRPDLMEERCLSAPAQERPGNKYSGSETFHPPAPPSRACALAVAARVPGVLAGRPNYSAGRKVHSTGPNSLHQTRDTKIEVDFLQGIFKYFAGRSRRIVTPCYQGDNEASLSAFTSTFK